MTERGMHPAVFAGLLGAATWGVPTSAYAATGNKELFEVMTDSLLLRFVAGCLVMGVAAAVAVSVMERRAEKKAEEEFNFASSLSNDSLLDILNDDSHHPGPKNESKDEKDDDSHRQPTSPMRIRKQTASGSPRHVKSLSSAHVLAQNPASAGKAAAGRHFATANASSKAEGSAPSAEKVQVAPAQTTKRGRHFASASVGAEMVRKSEPASASLETGKRQTTTPRPTGRPDRQKLYQLPVIESRYVSSNQGAPLPVMAVGEDPQVLSANPVIPIPGSPSSTSSLSLLSLPLGAPTTDVPLTVLPPTNAPLTTVESKTAPSLSATGRLRLRERMAAKTKGVREVLAERLNPNALDDVPHIARADGTLGEIAPSWFDQTLVPAIGKKLSEITGQLEDTAEREPVDPKAIGPDDTSARSRYIASHVAEVNDGLFPERRSVEELEDNDVWDQALAAMGEAIGERPTGLGDVVTSSSTTGDPDVLDAPTGFIPFRVPAAHPEVVDTHTYVDYLIREELSQNESQTLRNSSFAHLKVIEGGTSPMRLHKPAEGRRPEPEPAPRNGRGRHFANPEAAAKAL